MYKKCNAVLAIVGLVMVGFLFVLVSLGTADPAYSMSVTNTSVTIVPARNIRSATAWAATNSYSNGDYAQYLRNVYMCVTNGVSGTTAPTHAEGISTDGALQWIHVPRGKRLGLTVIITGTNTVSLKTGGGNAVANQGIVLFGQGSSWCPPTPPQGEVQAIGAITNITGIAIQEW